MAPGAGRRADEAGGVLGAGGGEERRRRQECQRERRGAEQCHADAKRRIGFLTFVMLVTFQP